jgi:hypothetical protein
MMRLAINHGYDTHSFEMDESTNALVKVGKLVELDGQDFSYEGGGVMVDHWVSNNEPEALYFWLDNGAEFCSHSFWVENMTSSRDTRWQMPRGVLCILSSDA